jgi:hypothetical protein
MLVEAVVLPPAASVEDGVAVERVGNDGSGAVECVSVAALAVVSAPGSACSQQT